MLSKILSWFWYSSSSESSAPSRPQPLAARKPSEPGMFQKMRDMQLRTPPSEMGLTKTSDDQIVGICMEQSMGNAVMSLRCFMEGTVSLYFSTGAAIIGVGQHEQGREKGLAFVKAASQFHEHFTPDQELALPEGGQTRFILLRFDGTFSAGALTEDLGENRSPLSPLFHLGHEVITAARLIQENRSKEA
ncbi:MAG: hypothetical protein IPK50_07870 [Fibrobacterota bacterium]|nr:hypothetical protein [Fibrobacterota bacterium]QQS06808.1 MAG: hypothetical protein IPK50_07870 [Fibrobacterota bacterium]